MKKFPQRKSPRLKGYDYSQSGGYFVTICTYERYYFFGDVLNGEMQYDPIGQIAMDCWQEIPEHHPTVELDYCVVMPNHVHGILVLNDNSPKLGTIIGTYKAAVTRKVRELQILDRIWQSGYYDHIIHDEPDLNRIREYVFYNPAKWEKDRYYAETNQ